MTVPIFFISLFTQYFHSVLNKDKNFIVRLVYFCLSIIVDILSSIKSINFKLIHILTWGITFLTLFPFPLYKTPKENNVLLKIFLYLFPFYMLFTRSYEGLFLMIFYNYLQLWIRMKWHEKEENKQEISDNNKIEEKKDNFNLLDVFMYMSLDYASCFSTGNIASISGFTLSSVFRFITDHWPMTITVLIMIKIFIPTIFVTVAQFEICKKYNYSTSDSLLMIIAMCEIMNIKFFFDIKDSGSWLQIGMSIAFFIISNVIAFIQFFIFLFVKFIFWIDTKVNTYEYEEIEAEQIMPPEKKMELELGIKNSNYKEII